MMDEPEPLQLADWRRRVAALYAALRTSADPEAAWRQWRAARDALFRDHPQSPLEPADISGFAGLAYFDYDPAWRFAVAIDGVADDAPVTSELVGDGPVTYRAVATTRGLAERLGRELTLYWIAGYGGGLFLPFADTSNGTASGAANGAGTYRGGRYLLDTIKGADLGRDGDGRLILDFNFAYNPSCAYSARWNCPLAPAANRLAVPVQAGERL